MRISDWSSDVCSSDLVCAVSLLLLFEYRQIALHYRRRDASLARQDISPRDLVRVFRVAELDRETGFPLLLEIGRASCRERVCKYVSISVVAVSLKKKNTKIRQQL